jgi:hypothetical protein
MSDLLSERASPQKQDNKFQTRTLEKEAISGQTFTKWAQHQDILTLSRKVTLKSLWITNRSSGWQDVFCVIIECLNKN